MASSQQFAMNIGGLMGTHRGVGSMPVDPPRLTTRPISSRRATSQPPDINRDVPATQGPRTR